MIFSKNLFTEKGNVRQIGTMPLYSLPNWHHNEVYFLKVEKVIAAYQQVSPL